MIFKIKLYSHCTLIDSDNVISGEILEIWQKIK